MLESVRFYTQNKTSQPLREAREEVRGSQSHTGSFSGNHEHLCSVWWQSIQWHRHQNASVWWWRCMKNYWYSKVHDNLPRICLDCSSEPAAWLCHISSQPLPVLLNNHTSHRLCSALVSFHPPPLFASPMFSSWLVVATKWSVAL